jgi:ABC-type transport system substrate-binding protein
MSKKFLKYGWMALALVLLGALVIFPACTGEGTTPPSPYIGSGKLDGNGIPPDFFSDLNIRKAFNYSFDWTTYISDALDGNGVQRGSPVVEGLYGYDPTTPMYSYDTAAAETAFKASTLGDVWGLGFKFTISYNSGNLARKTACEILATDLSHLNTKFQLSILPMAWPTILSTILDKTIPIFEIGWLPDFAHADNFIVPFMATYGTFSEWQGYGSATLDAQILAARQDTNETTQLAKYAALQQKYHDDAPSILLAQPIVRRYFTAHVNGFYYNPCESSAAGRIVNMSKSDNGGPIPYKNPTVFTEETIGDAESLDPAWTYDTAGGTYIGRIYDTLIYYDGNSTSTFVGVAATNWTWSDNDTTVTFTLRPGVKFANGDNLTASDVKYSFMREMVIDRPGGPMWLLYGPLLGTSGIDDYASDAAAYAALDAAIDVINPSTVAFHLDGAYWKLPFLQILCGSWGSIVDESWCIGLSDWDGTVGGIAAVKHPADPGDTKLFNQTNGSGPWQLSNTADWVPNDKITLHANPYWWGGTPPFATVITIIDTVWANRKLALLAGDADYVDTPAANYAEMQATDGLNKYINLPSLSIDAMFFTFDIGGTSS